jgi:hypothetical protein
MDDPMIIQITAKDIAEISVPEIIENNEDAPPEHNSGRKWNHGSTQTSDDMYLSGLMCE